MVGLAEFNEGKGRKGWDKVKDISITWERGGGGTGQGCGRIRRLRVRIIEIRLKSMVRRIG